jgi:hypothetical protein
MLSRYPDTRDADVAFAAAPDRDQGLVNRHLATAVDIRDYETRGWFCHAKCVSILLPET